MIAFAAVCPKAGPTRPADTVRLSRSLEEETPLPTTLLAIDDSVTMRKVLEMTFAGEDYRVVTADSGDAGLAKLRAERPAVVLCDATLDGAGGYALCAKIKAENPTVAVVILASKQQPYDGQKGQGARADDYIEKPFDTQQLIDKVKRLVGRPFGEVVPPAVARPAGAGATTQPGVPAFGAPVSARPAPPPAPPARPPAPVGMPLNPRPTAPGLGAAGAASPQAPVGRGTLSYGGGSTPSPGPVTAPPSGPARAPAPPAAPPPAPALSHVATTVPVPASAAAPHAAPSHAGASVAGVVASATNGQLAAKLAHLGLTDAQVSAVLALSRDVVEKVVWEVVPVLAETMIREEIKRLTSE
jgi:CheY-like chemotaxis protein